MKKSLIKKISLVALGGLMTASLVTGCGSVQESNIDLTIMATTDVHNYLMNYDYYTVSESDSYGLNKISTVVNKYRNESKEKNKSDIDNVLVVDNGDLLQGNPLGDYFAKVNPIESGTQHPVHKALSTVKYDAATLGNHEFNFGLDYLHQAITDSKVNIVNANVYNAQTKEPEFKQYEIITKKVIDDNGKEQEIKVGVTGFVPPQILNWDKLNLEGKVEVKDIKESAEEVIPKMKKAGADVVIVLSHSGYGDATYEKGEENLTYELTKVKGIDAIVAGHSHEIFPAEKFNEENPTLENVDVKKGTMNNIPTVQPSKYSEGVGVINLKITKSKNGYKVSEGTAKYEPVKEVENDPAFDEVMKEDHENVIKYVNSPVGKTTTDINTYFALVSDNSAVQLISDAQIEYAKRKVQEEESLAQYRDLPILSAAAPFKAGLSKDGTKSEDYVEVNQGDISIKDVSSIYKYPNTASIMKVNGKDIRNWLEMTSGIFNTIDVSKSEPQELLNSAYPAYNFDTIDGLTYEIDITKNARYNKDGELVNADSYRINNLKFNGNDLKDEDEFLVITNNYRASGGGNFPIFENKDAVALITSDETRQIIADYIEQKGTITPYVDNNWKIADIAGNVNVTFLSNSNGEAELANYPYITVNSKKDKGLTEYRYNFK